MIVVYSKENCPQCTQSIAFLDKKGIEYEIKKLDRDYTREELSCLFDVLDTPLPRSFPIIFKDLAFLGGFKELVSEVSRGNI